MIRLLSNLKYFIVNVPINSKFYHLPLPPKLSLAFSLLKNQTKKNQKLVLLEHIVDLLQADPKLILSESQKSILKAQINSYQYKVKNQIDYNNYGAPHLKRNEKIVTIAWIIKKLNLLKYHKNLYQQIIERVLQDQWYVNFDQSVKAMQAFTDIQNIQIKNQIYQKIERNVGITIWEVNMLYYKRLAISLLEANRFQSPLWNKLQQHIVTNLGMQYTTKTLCDIFKAFAISRNGSQDLFTGFQYVITQGHLYKNSFLAPNRSQFDTSGQFFALITKTYGQIKKNSDIYLQEDFKQYIFDALISKKTQYVQLSSFTQIIGYLPLMKFDQQQQNEIFTNLLQTKKPSKISSIQDIKQFYDTISNLDQRYKNVLNKFSQTVQNILVKQIQEKYMEPKHMVQIINYLLQKQIPINQSRVIGAFNKYMDNNFKYLTGKQAKEIIKMIQQVPKIGQQTSSRLLLPSSKTVNNINNKLEKIL